MVGRMDLRTKAGKAEFAAMKARRAEVDRLLQFSKLELLVVEAELVDGSTGEVSSGFRLESGVVAGVVEGEVVCVLQGLLLDEQFGARDVPGGVVLYRHDAFTSRASAERSARVWRAKFARVEGSEG